MRSNQTHPQRSRSFDAASLGSTVSMLSGREKDCCEDCGSCKCCSRRCVCISVFVLLGLAIMAAAVALAIIFGIPQRTPVNRYCTSNNMTGYLCDDRVTCIPASSVCNGISNCANGEDENSEICTDLPKNLPTYLIFKCGNPQFWIYIDEKCNDINNCGDCSDEVGILANCPSCGANWWPCTSVFYEYCKCIPRSLCRDGVQHCTDWSDEYKCTP
ncbi:low-density lipoprotein receptor class A domain-containing protein 1-like [Acipenser ruthenus]|uniref:low-density lipoprotein receptor class A domain-containing protein 1-like n=1 Tax=Acipenser ruthenus TaxID=7906 RepID=UPI00145C0A76|nr:low-density lipoprotein receptor class A domain-containing protein 1-like [Acipenser ruthenus]